MKILVTGATDGIGLETVKKLKSFGHEVLAHGRNKDKLSKLSNEFQVECYRADLSNLDEVVQLADEVSKNHSQLDVLINNAGVLKTSSTKTESGLDVRFVVNTIAPYLLTKKLLSLFNSEGRIINLSSAAQASVDLEALRGKVSLEDFEAYAQSKLAITMWSRYLAHELKKTGPVVIAVNPGSLLGSKMVKEGFGMDGKDIGIGADILTRLSLDKEFSEFSGQYFDNDSGEFSPPHEDGCNELKIKEVVQTIESLMTI